MRKFPLEVVLLFASGLLVGVAWTFMLQSEPPTIIEHDVVCVADSANFQRKMQSMETEVARLMGVIERQQRRYDYHMKANHDVSR